MYRGSLSINALHACVYVYIQQLSSFRAPTLWFIDLTVATCHIKIDTLSWVNANFFHKKMDKTRKYSKSTADGYYAHKAFNTERVFKYFECLLTCNLKILEGIDVLY